VGVYVCVYMSTNVSVCTNTCVRMSEMTRVCSCVRVSAWACVSRHIGWADDLCVNRIVLCLDAKC